MQRDWEIVHSHTSREGNTVADKLANFSLDCALGLSILTDPPDCIRSILFEDFCGVTFHQSYNFVVSFFLLGDWPLLFTKEKSESTISSYFKRVFM